MNYLQLSRYAVLMASILITVGLYSQAVKIWRTESAKDFSFLIVVAIFFNEIIWINYGFSLKEWPIILISSLNLPGAVVIVIGYIKYRKPKNY